MTSRSDGSAGAPALLLLSAVCFGFMAFLSKLATDRYDGAAIAVVRFGSGLLIALLVHAAGKTRLSARRVRPLMLRGVFGGIAVLLWYLSMEHLGAGLATLLNYTSPVFTLVIARLALKEVLPARALIALFVASTGVVLVVTSQSDAATGPPFWIGLATISAIFSAGAVTMVRALRSAEPPEPAWNIFAFFCAGGVLCAAPLARRWSVPNLADLAIFAGVSGFALVGQLAMNSALRHVPAAIQGITAQISVVVAGALGGLFLGEVWTTLGLIGAGLTLSGAAFGSTVRAAPLKPATLPAFAD